MGLFDKIYRKNISSDKLGRQIIGALFQWRAKPFWAFVLLVTPLSVGLSMVLSPDSFTPCLFLLGLNLLVWLLIKVCHALTDIFSLNRNDNGITVCQIVILAAIGFWIIGFMLIFDIRNNGRMAAAMGVIGAVLGWIFQDRVKGVGLCELDVSANLSLQVLDCRNNPSLSVIWLKSGQDIGTLNCDSNVSLRYK